MSREALLGIISVDCPESARIMIKMMAGDRKIKFALSALTPFADRCEPVAVCDNTPTAHQRGTRKAGIRSCPQPSSMLSSTHKIRATNYQTTSSYRFRVATSLQQFNQHVEGRNPTETDDLEGPRSVDLLIAMYRSAPDGRRLKSSS